MSTYLRMWELIKKTPMNERQTFLNTHSPAKGINLVFNGETFFDVDLLEALRNSVRQCD